MRLVKGLNMTAKKLKLKVYMEMLNNQTFNKLTYTLHPSD